MPGAEPQISALPPAAYSPLKAESGSESVSFTSFLVSLIPGFYFLLIATAAFAVGFFSLRIESPAADFEARNWYAFLPSAAAFLVLLLLLRPVLRRRPAFSAGSPVDLAKENGFAELLNSVAK